MALAKIFEVGKYGVIQDIEDHELPPEAWTDAKNVRFFAGKALRMTGQDSVHETVQVAPYNVFYCPIAGANYWVYTGLSSVYAVTGSTHTDISKSGGYSAVADTPWTGGVLNGLLILNNGVDNPQQWSLSGPSVALADLSNWLASTTCKVMRPFREYLVAMDITESGTHDEDLLIWSQPAEPRSAPASWDYTDATKDAGTKVFSDSPGKLLDCLQLGGVNIVYKQDSTHLMQFVGGQYIHRFDPLFSNTGMLTYRCAVNVPKFGHFVVTDDDIITHHGVGNPESVLTNKVRQALFNSIDQDNYERSFVMPNYRMREIWFCYPSIGASYPNTALVWNYTTGAITFRDIPNCMGAGFGYLTPTVDSTWNADSGFWNDDDTIWNDTGESATSRRPLLAGTNDTKLFRPDQTYQFDGTNYEAYLERTGLAVVGSDREGKPKVDINIRKLFKRVYIRAKGGPFQVKLGIQETVDEPVTWGTAIDFNPATMTSIPFDQSGRLMSINFRNSDNATWTLNGYDVEVEPLGEY